MYVMNEWFNLYNNKEWYESNEIILLKMNDVIDGSLSWCMYI